MNAFAEITALKKNTGSMFVSLKREHRDYANCDSYESEWPGVSPLVSYCP